MEICVSGATALLVIDVQCALFETAPSPLEAEGVIQRINDLTSRAREAEVLVYFIQQDGSSEDGLLPMSRGWQLRPDLHTAPQDRFIRKTTCDAFFQTTLEADLRAHSVQNLVVTGYATEFCVDSTVRNACSKGFRVFVAADAHTTNDNPVLTARQIRDHHNWTWANCAAAPSVTVALAAELNFEVPKPA